MLLKQRKILVRAELDPDAVRAVLRRDVVVDPLVAVLEECAPRDVFGPLRVLDNAGTCVCRRRLDRVVTGARHRRHGH